MTAREASSTVPSTMTNESRESDSSTSAEDTHVYQHTMVDGVKATVTVIFGAKTITVAASPSPMPIAYLAEYNVWLHEVIVPDIMSRATWPQMVYLSKYAASLIGL